MRLALLLQTPAARSFLIAVIYLTLGFALGTSYNAYTNQRLKICLDSATESGTLNPK